MYYEIQLYRRPTMQPLKIETPSLKENKLIFSKKKQIMKTYICEHKMIQNQMYFTVPIISISLNEL